jgi:hypothetical protein
MDMAADEAAPGADDAEEAEPAADSSDEEHEKEDDAHQQEDLKELEAARKERTDLMEAELTPKKGQGGAGAAAAAEGDGEAATGSAFDKFQFLVGQSEVFAHFLAGEQQQATTTSNYWSLALVSE